METRKDCSLGPWDPSPGSPEDVGDQRDHAWKRSSSSRVFFEAPMQRDVCIELPEEEWEEGDGDKDLVGVLRQSLY